MAPWTRYNSSMFATDGTTIFYPNGPDRVFAITLWALAHWDGSDSAADDITERADLCSMVTTTIGPDAADAPRMLASISAEQPQPPLTWRGEAEDFADALELWADYCDRIAAAEDSADAIRGSIERAA